MLKLALPILTLSALSACAVRDLTAHLSAEQVLAAVEARYVNAPNITWNSELDTDQESGRKAKARGASGEFSFEGNDKFRIAFKSKDKAKLAVVIQSDGVSAYAIDGDQDERTDFPLRAEFGRILRKLVARTGISLIVQSDVIPFNELIQPDDVARIYPVRGVRFGLDSLMQGRETRMIEYTVELPTPGPVLKMSVWIDRRTLSILRRESAEVGGATLFERTLETVFDYGTRVGGRIIRSSISCPGGPDYLPAVT